MAVRSWSKGWQLPVLFALLATLVHETSLSLVDLDLIRAKFETFVGLIASKDLRDADFAKPLLDGREIMKVLGVGKGGKYLKTMNWRLSNSTTLDASWSRSKIGLFDNGLDGSVIQILTKRMR